MSAFLDFKHKERTRSAKCRLANQSGQLTLDFLFASVLLFSTMALIGVLCFALTLSEVVQYVTFSAARAYFAGDVSPDVQANNGIAKAQRLMKVIPFLSGALANKWITLSKTPRVEYMGYNSPTYSYAQQIGVPADPAPVSKNRDQFTGVQFTMTIPLLNMNLPLLGQFNISDDKGKGIRVSSFLMREPSLKECTTYMNNTYEALARLRPPPGGTVSGSYILMMDNGC